MRSFATLLLCDFARNSLRSLRLCGSFKKRCWEVEGMRSLFGKLKGCDRCLGSGGGAIAQVLTCQFAVWGS
ncbi:hypothetical protein H5968_11225 [Sphaerospermopsis sp. LEGE 00249]|nr:hypothetical protein [Sphaerospermopsis sp. LEGE 00249]